MPIFFIWYNSLDSLSHSLSLSIIIFFFINLVFITTPLVWNLLSFLLQYWFYCLFIFVFNSRIVIKSIFRNLSINCLNHCYCPTIRILFIGIYVNIIYFFIIYSLFKVIIIHLFSFIFNPIIIQLYNNFHLKYYNHVSIFLKEL